MEGNCIEVKHFEDHIFDQWSLGQSLGLVNQISMTNHFEKFCKFMIS